AKAGALAPAFGFLRKRWRTFVGSLLIVAGVVGLGIPLVSYFIAEPGDVLLAGDVPQFMFADGSDGVPTFGNNRLLIPQAGISMPMLTGGEEVLEEGAWLTGAEPGTPGNAVIFGHRFKYLPPLSNTMFNLDELAVGDVFTVRWQGADLHYRVVETAVVQPTDVWVARDFGDERVTLITCTPVWSTAQRLVVVGLPVE
ncbi:MAG TPA: sortase, partial [Candidatus Paceibacterota bacterium]|nr:sortase [Candidatus Paceibacterota bacterium]